MYISLISAPLGAAAQYGALNNVLSATDHTLSQAFREAGAGMPVFSVPAPVSISTDERYSDTPAEQYLPLSKRAVLEYEYTSSEFTAPKTIRLEYLSYSDKDKTAMINMIIFNKTRPKVSNFVVIAGENGVRSSDSPVYGARLEFPLPLTYNSVWNEGPDRSRVAALNAKVTVPAGAYTGCLKITTRLSGGDAGSAERYYAPGVGLVYEQINSEDRQETVKLVSYQLK
ncbi:MAG TPA: hypothetical protein DEQ38_12650 [Elusimicrobia bacterium]|nr:MAG: hypothetical protein A2089_08575 [Elusimicrobia bacterium GWD2_63_28]HCC48948.1 hypothetical protein [Elusimicrobiota bacterium]